MAADLHIHTTASDGKWDPTRLGEEALKRGLTIISITDHDSIAAIIPAQINSPNQVTVIPGVEISTEYQECQVHILGYWLDLEDPQLKETLRKQRSHRQMRVEAMVAKLNGLGFQISFSDVKKQAQDGSLGRPHVAAALQEHGYVSSRDEAFAHWIGDGKPGYVPRNKLTPYQAIDIIKQTGGVPVLAHPGLMNNDELIPSLVYAGLLGIEVIHSTHTPSQVEHYTQLANSLNVLPSGGSDCHGPGGKDRMYLGDYEIPDEWVYHLKASLTNTPY